jgi:hypothetical protein
MKAVILVPFRSDAAERERNWRFCLARLERHGAKIHTGDSRGEWSRSEALNRAAARSRWDVALILDADTTFAHYSQIEQALMRAGESGTYVAAHDALYYLTEEGTEQALRGLPVARCEHDENQTTSWLDGIAIRRDLWDKVGGFDERFRGWGYQGMAFMCSCSRLVAKERVPGGIYHLAHPGTWGDKDLTHAETNRALYEKEYA